MATDSRKVLAELLGQPPEELAGYILIGITTSMKTLVLTNSQNTEQVADVLDRTAREVALKRGPDEFDKSELV